MDNKYQNYRKHSVELFNLIEEYLSLIPLDYIPCLLDSDDEKKEKAEYALKFLQKNERALEIQEDVMRLLNNKELITINMEE